MQLVLQSFDIFTLVSFLLLETSVNRKCHSHDSVIMLFSKHIRGCQGKLMEKNNNKIQGYNKGRRCSVLCRTQLIVLNYIWHDAFRFSSRCDHSIQTDKTSEYIYRKNCRNNVLMPLIIYFYLLAKFRGKNPTAS